MGAFWYTNLVDKGAEHMCRQTTPNQTRKDKIPDYTNIFDMEKMIIPMFINKCHWTCCCINFSDKKFEYYDSLHWEATAVFSNMEKYIITELTVKNGYDKATCELELEQWIPEKQTGYPTQANDKDCGVYTLKCIEWISENMFIGYDDKDMLYFRKRILCDIVKSSIS